MDLGKITINNTAPCYIVGPDGSETDIVIEMYGIDSKERQVAFRNSLDKLPKGEKATADDIEARGIDLLAGCIAGWSNINIGDKELKCTMKNKIDVLSEHKWLREQIDRFCASRVNFLEKA